MEHLGQLSVARMVDLPFRLLRPRFLQLWLPTTALAVVANSPLNFAVASGALDTRADGLPTLKMLAGFLVAYPLAFVGYSVLAAIVFGAVVEFMEGRPADLFRSLRSLDLSRIWVIVLLYVLVVLGAGCCIVPGLAIGTYMGLATPAVFVEGRSVGAAFQRSLDLVRGGRDGRWWGDVAARSLAVVVVSVMLQYALVGIVTLPQMLLGLKTGLESAASGVPAPSASALTPWWLQVATAVAGGGVFALVLLYNAAGTLLVFRYARERLEGTGLETAIQDAQQP